MGSAGKHERTFRSWSVGVVLVLGLAALLATRQTEAQSETGIGGGPQFELDRGWSQPLGNDWMLGAASAIAVDARDHVWLLQAPTGPWPIGDPSGVNRGLYDQPPAAEEITAAAKKIAPPVIEFDPAGKTVGGWGGPGTGYSWMVRGESALFPEGTPAEHGMAVDSKGNVWVTGNGHVVLKFSPSGQFLLQIGELGKTGGNADTRLLGNPTSVGVSPAGDEVYVADGYVNRRVIVFDAETGAYKRHWGAYGKPVDPGPVQRRFDPNGPLPPSFFAVHCVKVAKDGLVYVCDRQRNRVQVFKADGAFVTEVFVAKQTATTGPPYGSVNDVAFSPDPEQTYMYVGDGTNSKIWILRRKDLQLLGSIDNSGNHYIAVDSKGNLYTIGHRGNAASRLIGPRRFALKGIAEVPAAAGAR